MTEHFPINPINPLKSSIMKNHVLKSLLGLVLIAFLFSGCDIFGSADDVEVKVELDVIFQADENGEFSNVTYVGDPVHLDLNTVPELQPYLDKIKEVKITKIEYSITGYTSEPPGTAVIFTDGKMMYESAAGTNESELSAVTTVNLMTASGVYELPINQPGFDGLAALLLDKNEAYVFTQGTLSSTPVSFNVPTTFYLTVRASAID